MGIRLRPQRLSVISRGIALTLAALSVVAIRPGFATPGDIFQMAAPVVGSAPPAATSIAAGDASVATQTGAVQYSYPIAVPPGRDGMQPHLSLTYSSQAPIYGGLAAGWTLAGIPEIMEDTSRGGLYKAAYGKRYESSMAGGRVLVPVNEPSPPQTMAYRAQNDATFTRYQLYVDDKAPQRWRALAPDGTVYTFGQTDTYHKGDCPLFSVSYAPVTQISDPFGNVVDFRYGAAFTDGQCVIRKIEYGANAAAGISHFATLDFNYDRTNNGINCPPDVWPGSQSSYATGRKIVRGAATLGFITITAYPPGSPGTPDHTRLITLGYDDTAASCTGAHAPYRSLASIQQSAWGTDSPRVDLPAVTFTYGNPDWGTGTLTYSGEVAANVPWQSATVLGNDMRNLGWGYRFNGSQWPTVEAMMVDVDGDGLVDRVVDASPSPSDGHVYTCQARWFRNPGPSGGQFVDMGLIPLPTLKWASTNSFTGSAWARQDPVGSDERCALNYQLTRYTNSSHTGGVLGCLGTGTCPTQGFCTDPANSICYCNDPNQPDYGTDCAETTNVTPPNTILAYRWIDFDNDGKVDLVASIAHGGYYDYNLVQGTRPGAPREPALFGTFPACPQPTFTAYPGYVEPYTHCNGMFAWFVYKNHGDGVFGQPQTGAPPLPDQITYEPIPLETSNGDSSITNAPVGQDQGWLDIDGDGISDAVVHPSTGGTWQVFRGDGTGALVPVTGASSYAFLGRQDVQINRTDCVTFGLCDPISVQGLADVNGDGLADQWVQTGSGATANVAMNDGTAFRVPAGSGELDTSVRPGADALVTGTMDPNGLYVAYGERFDVLRPFDTDLDGRVDALDNNSTRFNLGGQFGSAAGILGDGLALQHRIVVTENQLDDYMFYAGGGGSFAPNSWELRSDEVDLDGDGIPEGVNFGNADYSSGLKISRVTTPPEPPRLLVGIDNHRGAATSITYAPLSNADVVKQEPTKGKASPRTEWVASTLTVTDSLANTTSSTGYYYEDPEWVPDDEGRYGFRGFDQVTTTGPSGAQTVERYSFAPDWSGRLSETLVIPKEAPKDVRSISATTWEKRELFGGVLVTYHPTLTQHYTCSDGQNEDDCKQAPAGYTQEVSTLKELASTTDPGGPTLLWQTITTLSQAGATEQDGDRRTQTTFALDADQDAYRLRDLVTTKEVRSGPAFETFAISQRTWDSKYEVALTDEVWVDDDDTHRAITRSDFDMNTGNIVKRWKPEQNAVSGAPTTYEYDARAVSPTKVTDELGHTVAYAYEPGTGTKLSTTGPNVAGCAATSSCPTGTPEQEEHAIRVDGLGREIESYETFSNDGSAYTLERTGITQYVDSMPNGTDPTSVTTQHLLDATVGSLDRQVTLLDGHGRPIRKTVSTFGSVPADAITTFTYGGDGTLTAVTLPDPSRNDSSTVTYTYTFDSLGRATGIRRPDSSTPGNQSGVDISYNGLTKTTTDVVGGAGGLAAKTVTTTDAFGRLTQVDELRDAPAEYATTLYTWGPDDNVSVVEDPEGVVTYLTHDFAGRRTLIKRGGRTWMYGYDRNGNMTSEQVPGSSGPLTDADYTTYTVYDDLDRPIKKLPGPRTLKESDQELFGTATELFIWDIGANHIGQLRYWRSYAPGASQPTIERDLGVNAQGRPTTTTENINVASYAGLTRSVSRDYFENGAPKSYKYNDQFSGPDSTNATVTIDPRGLPSSVTVDGVGCSQSGLQQTTITMHRNVAGLVTSRTTSNPTATWTYDTLGRITDQTVVGSAQIVRQNVKYYGNDNPSSLDHYLGTALRNFEFTYDTRHQLTGVHETTSPGYFDATYEYGAAGRFTHATETATGASGGEVSPRNVNYEYAGDDPEEVTALHNVSDGSEFATYKFDEAGNEATRNYKTGDSWEYTYDGKDQLRRVLRTSASGVQSSEEYWYDEAGSRVLTLKRDVKGNPTELVWWIGDVEAHYDGAGALLRNETYVSLASSLLRLTRDRACSTGLVLPFEFLFHGLGGSTIATVDRSGTTGTALSYAPFGELLETINDASGERHRLNDKYVDEISNLGYYGARYYDTTSMTWTQADPSFRFAPDDGGEQPRLAMLYTNDLNNPLRYVDPDGRAPLGQIIADGVKAGEEVLDAVVTNVVLAKGSGPVIAAGAATGGTVIAETVGVTAAEAGGTGLMAGLGMFVVAPLGGAYLAYKICDQPGTGKPDPMQGTGNGSHDDGEPPDLVRLPKLPKNKPRHWPRGEKFPPDPPGTVTKVPRAKRVPPKGWLRRWWEKVFGGAKTNSTTTTHDKPADANKDGTVTKDEEATWMSEQNNQIQ